MDEQDRLRAEMTQHSKISKPRGDNFTMRSTENQEKRYYQWLGIDLRFVQRIRPLYA